MASQTVPDVRYIRRIGSNSIFSGCPDRWRLSGILKIYDNIICVNQGYFYTQSNQNSDFTDDELLQKPGTRCQLRHPSRIDQNPFVFANVAALRIFFPSFLYIPVASCFWSWFKPLARGVFREKKSYYWKQPTGQPLHLWQVTSRTFRLLQAWTGDCAIAPQNNGWLLFYNMIAQWPIQAWIVTIFTTYENIAVRNVLEIADIGDNVCRWLLRSLR